MRKTYELPVDPDEITHEYDRADLDNASDTDMFNLAAHVVAVPREAPANSFVLHAPLELLARSLLLPLVPATDRRAVRERMLWVAAKYEAESPPVRQAPARGFASSDDANREIVDAIANRDLLAVDEAAAWHADHCPADEVLRLADSTYTMLAAAGHAPIAFFLLSRVSTTNRSALALLRPLMRELARAPELRVTWTDAPDWRAGREEVFATGLAQVPRLGLPGNDFIFPLVHQVDTSGVAQDAIAPTMPSDLTSAALASLRVAAHSMLQDDLTFAPYGWTHCLTLPQAIFEMLPWISDARRAAAIAATYVVAFRAGERSYDLDLTWKPEPTSVGLVAALDQGLGTAAAAWYHAPAEEFASALPCSSDEPRPMKTRTSPSTRSPVSRQPYAIPPRRTCTWRQLHRSPRGGPLPDSTQRDSMTTNEVQLALVVRLHARPDTSVELADFLRGAVDAANAESGTTVWLALQTNERTFWIVDAFPTERDREAHLAGPIAAALMQHADRLLADPPEILPASVLAAKLL